MCVVCWVRERLAALGLLCLRWFAFVEAEPEEARAYYRDGQTTTAESVRDGLPPGPWS